MDTLIKALHKERESARIYDKASSFHNGVFAECVRLKESHINAICEFLKSEAHTPKDDEKSNFGDKNSHLNDKSANFKDKKVNFSNENLNFKDKNADFDDEILDLSSDFSECVGFLIEHENENIAFYNEILDESSDENAKDLFYLFQAQSYNDILPALQSLNSLNNEQNSSGFNFNELNFLHNALNSNQIFNEIEKSKEFFNETAQTLERLKNKQLSHAELESFLRKLNFSLLGGAVLGAGLAFMFNEISNQYTKD